MRERRRHAGREEGETEQCGGKETRTVPFALPSPGHQVPFEGTRGPQEPPILAPHRGEGRAEDAPNSCALMSFPQIRPTPQHRQKIPRGDRAQAGWLPPSAPRSSWRRKERWTAAPHAPGQARSTCGERSLRPHHHPLQPSGQRAMPRAGTAR